MVAKSRRRGRADSSKSDPATEYARAVVDGAIVAGPHVRDACRRHLRDLVEGPKRGLIWDIAAQQRVLAFFREVLRLAAGEHEGRPFEVEPWQAFVLGSLFGWKRDDGTRRFRQGFGETAKGSGKSPLSAGIGLYMLTADHEPRAEIYAAASMKDQAMVLFRQAVAMVDQSAELANRITKSGGPGREWNLAHLRSGSFFRPIASDTKQSGPLPHCALLDEVHEHRDATMIEMMQAGFKGRRQPLVFMITNSGVDKKSVCFQYHDYAVKVAAGVIEDDAFFAYVCGLDEKDDPFKDEACWVKANPSLGVTVKRDYLALQVAQARGMPAKESLVRRLNFCQWVESLAGMFDRDLWEVSLADLALERFRGQVCNAAIDLSGKNDLTALTLTFPLVEPLPAITMFWTPGETIAERARRDAVPYELWRDQGFIEAPPGRSIDYAFVAKRIGELDAMFDLREIAFDRFRIEDLQREMTAQGIEWHAPKDGETGAGIAMVPYGQGFVDMAPAVDAVETAVANGKIRIAANPVMTMCAANATLEQDAAGNRKFSKRKAAGRIDGMISLAMAVRRAGLLSESRGTRIGRAEEVIF